MSRAEQAAAKMRMEIRNAKANDMFMNREVTFVLWEDGQERLVHLPKMRYFAFICNQ